MPKLTLDPQLQAKLQNLTTELELCDESGKTLGFFLPAQRHRELIYAWLNAQVSDEELEEARREGGGRPLSQILADLEKRCDTP